MNFFSKYKPHLFCQGKRWYIRKWVTFEGWNYLDAQGTPYWWHGPVEVKRYCGFDSEQEARDYFPITKKL